jgi:N-acylglucosamine 2-epimerase
MELFRRIRDSRNNPEMTPAKYEPAMATRGHSLTMILINVANVLKCVSDDPVLDGQINESVDELMRYFVRPEFKCVLETVGLNGEFIDTIAGRTINPGHAIETSWFLMEVASFRGDGALLEKALQILDWSWDWGWDSECGGGIISFRDCRGFPPQCYEQDMKFWWPQCEAVIANLMAHRMTGESKYFDRFRTAADWSWEHLKDREYPEWYGYLHRDGTVAQPAKGNLFKGPFHLPRMLIVSEKLCRGKAGMRI